MRRTRVKRWRCVVSVGLLFVGGCASSTPYPETWTPPADGASGWCRTPQGVFQVVPAAGTPAPDDARQSLGLQEIFFGDLLNGFAITHVSLDTLPGGELRARPWVGDVALAEARIIAPSRRGCRSDRWRVSTGWDVDGFMITAGLLYTGGIIVPAASEQHFVLGRTALGELTVRYRARTAGTLFLFFPFRSVEQDAWFLYPPKGDEDVQ